MKPFDDWTVTGNSRADIGLAWLTGGLSGLFANTPEAHMQRRKNKGKVQGNDQLGINPMDAPSWIQNMMSTGRDENGNISSKSAKRGGGFTNKEIAASMAEYQQLQEQRAYEEGQWEKRESLQGQVAQAKEAGLNPALMYGSGASAGSGQIASSDMDVDGSSEYDEFGGAFDVLGQIFGLVDAGQSVASTVSGMKTQATQRKNETARTEADVANTNADTEFKQAQTEGQRNLNANFWRKADDEHARAATDVALGEANIAKTDAERKYIDEQASAISKQLELKREELAIASYNAESERMQVVSNCKKAMHEITLIDQQTKESASRTKLNERTAALTDAQIDKVNKEITSIGKDIMSKEWDIYWEQCKKVYGVPDEYVAYCIGMQSQLSKEEFARWLAGFRKAATNKATAIQYSVSFTRKLGPLGYTTSGTDIMNTPLPEDSGIQK